MDSVQDALAQLGFPAQTERGRKMAIRGSEKHDERFQQAEAAKPQEQRLLNRQDLDEDARKIFVQTTLKHMRRTISSFVRFHTTTLGATTEEAMQYFRKGGPLPDRPLIRKYLIWFASGSQGRMELQTVEESATSIRRPPSMQSMITQYSSLNTCLRYFNQRPDMLLASDTRLWIKTDLSNELSLRKDMKAKPIAYAADTTSVIQSMCMPTFQWSFRTLRHLLNILLCINILVDSSGRIGELCVNKQDIKHVAHWSDVEFYVFPADEDLIADGGSRLDCWALFRTRWGKHRKLEPSEFKKTPVHLLPPKWAFEDSCRLLLLLALIEGHLDGFNTWDDLMSINASKDGTRIRIKESSMDIPLLRRAYSFDSLADLPCDFSTMNNSLKASGVHCGFADTLTSYALRRYMAFVLDNVLKDHDRAKHIGHTSGDYKTFRPYQSSTSQIDTQAISRGINVVSKNLLKMSSISLGKAKVGADSVSQAGIDAVDSHPEYLQATKDFEIADAALHQKYKTLNAAKDANDELYTIYKRTQTRRIGVRTRLMHLAFMGERREKAKGVSYVVKLQQSNNQPSLDAQHQLGDSMLGANLATYNGSLTEFTELLNQLEDPLQNALEAQFGSMTLEQIDEQMGGCPDEETGAGFDMFTTLDESSDAESTVSIDDVEGVEENRGLVILSCDNNDSLNPLYRLHHIQDTGYSYTASTRTAKRNSFSPFLPQLQGIYSEITSGALASDDVSNLLEMLFRSERNDNYLPLHWQPYDGSTACLFCHKIDVVDSQGRPQPKAFQHVYECARTFYTDVSQALWDRYISETYTPCDWVSVRRGEPPVCGKLMPCSRSHHEHRRAHLKVARGKGKVIRCHFGQCRGRTSFDSVDDLYVHAEKVHNVLWLQGPLGMFFFCVFCEDFVFEGEGTLGYTQHIESHWQDAVNNVYCSGYNVVIQGLSKRTMSTGHCIFCLHQPSRNMSERVRCFNYDSLLAPHLWREHIEEMDDLQHHFCPASSAAGAVPIYCAFNEPMTKDELVGHLIAVHRVEVPVTAPPKHQKASKKLSGAPKKSPSKPVSPKRPKAPKKMASAKVSKSAASVVTKRRTAGSDASISPMKPRTKRSKKQHATQETNERAAQEMNAFIDPRLLEGA